MSARLEQIYQQGIELHEMYNDEHEKKKVFFSSGYKQKSTYADLKVKKICEHHSCNVEFIKESTNQKFCDKHSKSYTLRKKAGLITKRYYADKEIYKNCEKCGYPYRVNSNYRKFCDMCSNSKNAKIRSGRITKTYNKRNG